MSLAGRQRLVLLRRTLLVLHLCNDRLIESKAVLFSVVVSNLWQVRDSVLLLTHDL